MSASECFARLTIDGETVELVLDAGALASLRKALTHAKGTRRRDLDRVVAAHLARKPDATLAELCDVARRRREDVAAARTRVRGVQTPDAGVAGSAASVPGPGNGTSLATAGAP
jgi:hypothetical protein